MPNSRAVSRRLRPSTNVEPSDKAPRFSCSRPTSANRDIGLPMATFYAARSGTAPQLLWPTFSPAHTTFEAGWLREASERLMNVRRETDTLAQQLAAAERRSSL